MSRTRKPTEGVLAQARSRRQFLAGLVVPVAAAAISPALAVAATAKSTKKSAAKPKAPATASGDPFASARPDVSIAKTPEERATLEKQWKGLVDVLEVIRKAELPAEGTAPVLAFAALPRDAARGSGDTVARKKS